VLRRVCASTPLDTDLPFNSGEDTRLEQPIWHSFLTDRDREVLGRARFGQRIGFGERPAVVVIDCQRYMVGERDGSGDWPSSCGETGWRAIDDTRRLLDAARAVGAPIFYTQFVLARDGSDIGVYGRKRALLPSEHWVLEDSLGAELLPELNRRPGELAFVKKKPSAFHGTPLLGYLVDRRIDTLIVCGGSTSNCVRATVFDSSSYNFRTIVPAGCVFDRIPVSHAISLFDMDRQYADVMSTDEVCSHLLKQTRITTTGESQ
jgi:nicotinamidase-related amidase